MSEANVTPEGGERARGEPPRGEDPAGRVAAGMGSCCGPEMPEMMQACPCASAVKGRWRTALVVCSLLFLTFIVCQVGGILGMIAFFRTF